MNPARGALSSIDRCWLRIGTSGDGSCPNLSEFDHCRNCPAFAQAGRSLLDREVPPEALAEWSARLAEAKEEESEKGLPALVFRLRDEWLALRTACLETVQPPRRWHGVPHRSSRVFLGIVNVGGEPVLCVSLAEALGLSLPAATPQETQARPRMVVLAREGRRFAFVADDVLGIRHLPAGGLESPPRTLSRSPARHVEAVTELRVVIGGRDDTLSVGLVDEARLTDALARSVTGG